MPALLEPVQLGQLRLRNRTVLAPMTRVSAEPEGNANELMRDYYQAFARGGFGLLITEGTYTDTAYSQGYFNQPGLATKAQRDSWIPVIEAVHQAGAAIVVQLMHGGAQTQGNIHHARHVAPSAVQPSGTQLSFYGGEGPYATPAEMTEEDIQEAIAGFVQAARHACEAGFDGVELHGANGYLLHEFLSAEFNQRIDRWGGDYKARLALPLAVIHAVREAVGADFLLGMRLSQGMVSASRMKWDGGVEEAKVRIAMLAEAGLDYLHITEYDVSAPAFAEGPTLSAIAKASVSIPVIGNGGVTTGEQAQKLIDDGELDLVAIGKAALANHDWPLRVRDGDAMSEFDQEMFPPMATLTNELAWRGVNDRASDNEAAPTGGNMHQRGYRRVTDKGNTKKGRFLLPKYHSAFGRLECLMSRRDNPINLNPINREEESSHVDQTCFYRPAHWFRSHDVLRQSLTYLPRL